MRCPVCKNDFTPNYLGRVCCSQRCADAKKGSFLDRFWARVKKLPGNGCWEWQGRIEKNGYARIRLENSRERVLVHRLSYELTVGSIPKGKLVLHDCDNRRCVRSSHLFIGTQKNNMEDMIAKGRANKAQGERHGMAKLSEQQVRALLAAYANGSSQMALALKYGVHFMTVHKIVNGKRWAHLPQG